jgi:hypothetical protein
MLKTSRWASLVVLTMALAGCSGSSNPPAGEEDQGPLPSGPLLDSFHIGFQNLTPVQTGLSAVVRVTRDTSASIAWGNLASPDALAKVEGCTYLRWRLMRDDVETLNNSAFRPTLDVRSGGHGPAVSNGGQVIDTPLGTPPPPSLRTHATAEVELEEGDEIRIALGARGGSETPLQEELYINTTTPGALQILEVGPRTFRCEPNIRGFEGNYASTGDSFGSMLRVERATARIEVAAEQGEAWLLFLPYPYPDAERNVGECHLEIHSRDELIARDDKAADGSDWGCTLRLVVPAGTLEYVIRDSYAHSPFLAYALWE